MIVETTSRIQVTLQNREGQAARDRAELRAGLLRTPREIPSRFFYDDRGSRLFERITELPEYYQTRTEHALLLAIADRVVAASGAEELVEIGSGAATKTRALLDAMARTGRLRLYAPVDVAEGTVRRIADELAAEYPGLAVHGVVGDFTAAIDALSSNHRGRRLVIFLGGTIGNLQPDEARELLARRHREMTPGDHFLLGVDLIKPVPRLEAAYNDAAGITAEFNRNILRVVNRLTGGDFQPAAFRHLAFYDSRQRWIEMRLRAASRQHVRLPAIELEIDLAPGEEIRTEISAKYDRASTEALLASAGFAPVAWYTDPGQLFGLSLARRT
ncbi:MAG TPA: L-histidine N(alpha)-methyltransferase [Thermoanaerobaculia bacterium]|nr:L-histidine N(alpha)-methyltransferase [Thermoanaerobaculia bacterium]